MSQLSHKKARALLQKEADLLITGDEKAALEEHLFSCKSCHSYAKDLFELEEILRNATHTRWNGYTFNLEFQSLTSSTRVQEGSRVKYPLYGTFVKITFVTTLVVASLLVTKMLGTQPISSLAILTVTPTRTPLADYIETVTEEITSKEFCDPVQYIVKESDTEENIAYQFGVSKESIIEQNHLDLEKIKPGTYLLIPMCTSTPTRTALIPKDTNTTTPTDIVK